MEGYLSQSPQKIGAFSTGSGLNFSEVSLCSLFCFLSSTFPPFKIYINITASIKDVIDKIVRYLKSLISFPCFSTISPHLLIESSTEFIKAIKNSISGLSLSLANLCACLAYFRGFFKCKGDWYTGKEAKKNKRTVRTIETAMKITDWGVEG